VKIANEDRPVELSLPPSIWDDLNALAKSQKVSIGDIARIAIYREISRHQKATAPLPPLHLSDRFRITAN